MTQHQIISIGMALINLIDIIIALYFYDGYLERKNIKLLKKYMGIICVIIYYTLDSIVISNSDLSAVSAIMFNLIIVLLMYNAKIHIKVIAGLFLTIFSFLSELLSAILLMRIFGFELAEARSNSVFFILGSVISKLLLIIIISLIIRIASKKTHKVSVDSWILILTIPVVSIYFVIHSIYAKVINNNFSISIIVLCCLVLYINFIAFYLFESIARQVDENLQYKLREKQLLMKQEQYKGVLRSYEHVKRIKHDMRNHLIILDGYMGDNQLVDAKEYVEELLGEMTELSKGIISGNIVIDALINEKTRITSTNNINFVTDIMIPRELKIRDMDLCIIVGNILDNAIEACERIQESGKVKEIEMKMRYKNDCLLINIKNTYEAQTIKGNEREFISSKANNQEHGFGMLNVNSAINRYEGNMNVKISEQYFESRILIHNEYDPH